MPQITLNHSFKNEVSKTISLSIPLIASQLIYSLSNFVGTAMVAHLGKDALAASVLVSMIWISLSVLFFGILNAVSVIVSHQYGAKNYRAIADTMGQAFLLGIIISVLLILILLCMPFFLRFSAQPPVVLELSYQYMRALLWTVPGLILLIIYEQFLAGIGRAKVVLRISLLIVPIEIPLIYLLIFGKWGFPACGVAGVGYGFAVTYTITAIGLMCYLRFAKQYQPYKIFLSIFPIKLRDLGELVYIGLPMGFMHVIEVSTFTVATFWIAQFGTSLLAAHQIVLQYFSFIITLAFAMSQAVTIRVGHAMGAQDKMGIKYAIYVGILLNFCCAVLIAIAFYFFPLVFIRLDVNIHQLTNTLLIQQTSSLLSISAVLLLFDNFRIMVFGALRGLKDTRFPMYASFVSFWLIGLTAAYLFGFIFPWESKGIWWGLTIGIASGAIIVYCRLRYVLYHRI